MAYIDAISTHNGAGNVTIYGYTSSSDGVGNVTLALDTSTSGAVILARDEITIVSATSPEELDAITNSLNGSINDLNAGLMNTNTAVGNLQGDMAAVSETVTTIENKVTTLEQTVEGWDFEWLTTNVTTIIDSMGNVETNQEEFLKFIRFIDGAIYIGESTSPVQLVMENDVIKFVQNDVTVAYISDNTLYITYVEVTESLKIGRFQFIPEQNGSLSVRYIG